MPSLRSFLDTAFAEAHEFGPIPAWWWSGERLEIGKLRLQLDQLRAMGIRQVIIINLAPSGTMFCSDADDPPYMSEAWWTIFRQVCDHAKSIDMKIWFYDQIGFSGASYQADIATEHPEHLALQLRSDTIEGTGELCISCPPHALPIACFTSDAAGNTQRIDLRGDRATISTEVPLRLTIVFAVRQGYDLFSRNACDRLLDAVHRQFEQRLPDHLGSTIAGSYQDELPDLPTWGVTFADTFEQRFGYRINDRIEDLFFDASPTSSRTRVHYHIHRAALAEDAFFKPFYQWHERHGLRCGFDQQSPAREARALGAIEKYADYMQTHRWYACPGSDLHGNGKLHASIAFLHQRPRVWLEGFHSTGWGGTIADTFDWLLPYLQQGVSLYNPHAVYYSTRQGWWEWAPPSTCWRQPYAMHYPHFASLVERLLSLLSRGTQQAGIGVLFPTATVQSGVGVGITFDAAKRADEALHETIGSVRWHQVKTGALDSMAVDYHILDEASIASAAGDDCISIHDVEMRTIILPRVTMLHAATIARLRRFAEQGGRVVSIGSSVIDIVEGGQCDVHALPGAIVVDRPDDLRLHLDASPRTIRCALPTLYRKLGNIHLVFIPASQGMATVVKWDSWFAPLETATLRPERYADRAAITLPDSARNLWKIDPRDGSTRPLRRHDRELMIDFDHSPFVLIAWDDSDDARTTVATAPIVERVETIPLSDTWTCEYALTLPTTHADIHDSAREYLRWPRTSVFQWTDHSTGISKRVRATFGPRATRINADGTTSHLEYSPQFGIERDTLHQLTLGPKGRVPEEFYDLGKLTAGECVTVQTSFAVDTMTAATLVFSANAVKFATLNGQPLSKRTHGHRVLFDCTLHAGANRLELTMTAERGGIVRASWCMVARDDAAHMVTPDRIIAPGSARLGTTLRFAKCFTLNADIGEFKLKVSTAAVATVLIDGRQLARLGGFDPYRLQPRGIVYTLELPRGEHEIAIEVIHTGSAVPILIDARGVDSNGQTVSVVSDGSWIVTRDDQPPAPVSIQLKQDADGSAWHLYRRPHPLPATDWLDSRERQSIVLDARLLPVLSTPHEQTFQWTVPPGAQAMQLPLMDAEIVSLMVDHRRCAVDSTGRVTLNGDEACEATLIVRSLHLGGAVWRDAVTYTFGTGRVRSGDFSANGLAEFSGAVRLTQHVQIDAQSDGRFELNCGHVRGSVEARVNGVAAGVCVIAPYRFDLTRHLRAGGNQIELVLTNTLANHMGHWSPTRCIALDQFHFGIFGPVQLTRHSSGEARS